LRQSFFEKEDQFKFTTDNYSDEFLNKAYVDPAWSELNLDYDTGINQH